MDEDGVGYADYSVDVILRKHIPAILPIKGKRVKVTYPGIPAFCNKCWKLGHAQWECKEKNKTNWLEFVCDLYLNDDVTEAMLGSWTTSLYKFHPSLGGVPKNGTTSQFVGPHKDLRQQLKANEAQASASDPAKTSDTPVNNDLRTLLESIRKQATDNSGQVQTQGQANNTERFRGQNKRGQRRGGGQHLLRGGHRNQNNTRGGVSNRGSNNRNNNNGDRRNLILASLAELLS